MSDKAPTYEEIEKHLASVNLKDFESGRKHFPGQLQASLMSARRTRWCGRFCLR